MGLSPLEGLYKLDFMLCKRHIKKNNQDEFQAQILLGLEERHNVVFHGKGANLWLVRAVQLPLTVNQKLVEVPSDYRFRVQHFLVQRNRLRALHVDLVLQREGTSIICRSIFQNLRQRCRFLTSKLIAGERKNFQPISIILFVQFLQLQIMLLGVSSLTRNIDNQDNLRIKITKK